jgi:hypothetical protein
MWKRFTVSLLNKNLPKVVLNRGLLPRRLGQLPGISFDFYKGVSFSFQTIFLSIEKSQNPAVDLQ